MISTKPFYLCFVFLILNLITVAQSTKSKKKLNVRTQRSELIYDNIDYISSIKTVKLHPLEEEAGFPIITKDKNEYLTITFDDIRADIRSLYFSVELCNADWTPSRVPVMDYLAGYTEDRINAIQSSQNTKIAYTHYSFTFPNDNIKPKIAGNYLLKVYEDADQTRLIFSRKVYVVNNLATLDVQLLPSLQTSKKQKNQKLNIVVNSTYEISNPRTNLQIHAFQNQRTDNFKILGEPAQITTQTISFNLPNTLDFEGNNEFRNVDLRSIRSASSHVKNIVHDTAIYVVLAVDDKRKLSNYMWNPDENGRFFIRNLDFEEANLQSEYIYTLFSLKDSANIKGDIYLVGGFNNFKTSAENKLTYNPTNKVWETTQLLKQGIYNYEYILKNGDKISTDVYSGSFFETENEYQILVYYRKPGTFWDEIIAYKNINKTKH